MQNKKVFYITETSLPSNSANIINSLKFCDALSKYYNVHLLQPHSSILISKIKKNFDIKNEISLINILDRNIKSRLDRFIFCLKVVIKIMNNKNSIHFILSRSILTSIILTFLNIKNILEIHHNLSGLSKILFNILIKLPVKKKLTILAINRNLIKDLKISKIKHIVLDDGSDVKKKEFSSNFKYENTCVYTGSLYKGKGLEIISKLSKIMPNVEFHIYGEKKTSDKVNSNSFISKNIKFKGHVSYSQINKILRKYHIALMPYEKKISARSSNLEISKYISPLKMFDYFAAGNIIFASNLKAFNHVLKNNVNALILNNSNIVNWKILINKVFRNLSDYDHIKYNALQSSKKFSWDNRAKKFLKFISFFKN
tara:strand:- start:5468 stop:6577 length:1110 start_codon:yes stop_codon:yes gene_type:complete